MVDVASAEYILWIQYTGFILDSTYWNQSTCKLIEAGKFTSLLILENNTLVFLSNREKCSIKFVFYETTLINVTFTGEITRK